MQLLNLLIYYNNSFWHDLKSLSLHPLWNAVQKYIIKYYAQNFKKKMFKYLVFVNYINWFLSKKRTQAHAQVLLI